MSETLNHRSPVDLLMLQGSLEWDESFDYKAERSRSVEPKTLTPQGMETPHHERDGAPE